MDRQREHAEPTVWEMPVKFNTLLSKDPLHLTFLKVFHVSSQHKYLTGWGELNFCQLELYVFPTTGLRGASRQKMVRWIICYYEAGLIYMIE